MEKSKPVGVWIRVSTEEQARAERPERYEKSVRSMPKVRVGIWKQRPSLRKDDFQPNS